MSQIYSLYQRPGLNNKTIENQIIEITTMMVGQWFTNDVVDDVLADLKFHDVICLESENRIICLIIFTSYEGTIRISLMGTDPNKHNKGYGSRLINHFFDYVVQIGFKEIELLTVKPSNPILKADEDKKSFRLWLTARFNESLRDALEILGLPTPKRM